MAVTGMGLGLEVALGWDWVRTRSRTRAWVPVHYAADQPLPLTATGIPWTPACPHPGMEEDFILRPHSNAQSSLALGQPMDPYFGSGDQMGNRAPWHGGGWTGIAGDGAVSSSFLHSTSHPAHTPLPCQRQQAKGSRQVAHPQLSPDVPSILEAPL